LKIWDYLRILTEIADHVSHIVDFRGIRHHRKGAHAAFFRIGTQRFGVTRSPTGNPRTVVERTSETGTHSWAHRYSDALNRPQEICLGKVDDPEIERRISSLVRLRRMTSPISTRSCSSSSTENLTTTKAPRRDLEHKMREHVILAQCILKGANLHAIHR
jgi:hypothetical protein